MKQKRMRGIQGVGALVVLSWLTTWLVSCGGDGPPLRTLTTADVTGLPAGDATGAGFSGTYVVNASRVEGCRCRSGTCSTIRAVTGTVTTVVQEGGMLTINGNCFGGVNADGAFWCCAAHQLMRAWAWWKSVSADLPLTPDTVAKERRRRCQGSGDKARLGGETKGAGGARR